MKHKLNNWIDTLLSVIIVIILILLFLIGLREFNLHKAVVAKNIDKTNQTIHTLQTEFETLKVTNANLIKQLSWQQSRIKELEGQTNAVEKLVYVEQPTVHKVPLNAQQTTPKPENNTSYLDYIPEEMIIVVVSTFELLRQIVVPKYSLN